MNRELELRLFVDEDWPQVWPLLQSTFRQAETYAYSPDIGEQAAHTEWVEKPLQTFVAVLDSQIVGTYYLKANQVGQGAHVCNCGYIVGETARGRGVASAMCEHSQEIARLAGFVAMQYNLVVSTNTGAIALWHKHGFATVGTLPKAFLSPTQGYVDALVMYKLL